MYAEMFAGLKSDPARHLSKVVTEDYDEVVLVRDINCCSMCEHHLLPFTGKAHVAYLPSGKVVGLSKLTRVVEEVARRPQVQESLTHTVAALVENGFSAGGVAVVVESTHSSMTMRGGAETRQSLPDERDEGHLQGRSQVQIRGSWPD